MSVQIIPVPSDRARAVWPLAERHIARALEYCRGAYTLDDVLAEIERSDAHLWLAQRADGHVVAAVVTRFNTYPQFRTLCAPWAGGSEVRTWLYKMLMALESWAMECGCKGIEFAGRPGWAKLAKMEQTAVVLYREFSNERIAELGDLSRRVA